MSHIGRLMAAALIVGGLAVAGFAQDSAQLPRQNDPGVTPPRVVKDVKPVYTKEAMEAGIQGTIDLEAVVLTDGTVGEITVTRSLDQKYGLDQQAMIALKEWQFAAGRKDGKAVPVVVTIEMTFILK
jgi:TonB family protein